jgi:hypothetical protein
MRPTEALRRHMEMGSTGALSVDLASGQAVSVYLLQGEILAAESAADGIELVRRLVNGEYITQEQGQTLVARLCHSPQVGDVLFGAVPDDLVMDLYGRRFRQNLADFLLCQAEARFTPKEDIHVENVQVGHDSYVLLEELQQQLELAAHLGEPAGSVFIARGEEPPSKPLEAFLLDRLPPAGSLDDLLETSPREPLETLVMVAELLESGCLVLAQDPESPLAPEGDEETAEIPVGEQPEDDEALEAGEEPSEELVQEPVVVEDASGLDPFFAVDDPSGDLGDEPMVVDDMSMLDGPVGESDLAMFADQDRVRGGGDGVFTVSRELLDTVDLSGVELIRTDNDPEEMVLEMEDGDEVEAAGGAVSLSFGSPPLTHEEAATKIQVTNEVLHQLCLALDDEHGSGSGQAAVQLLVESARTDLAVLFLNVDADRDGAIDTQRVIANIDRRPEAERRRLLNRAMRDLIERGFTMAVERISDERFEAMLESISGYQQRLGL